MLAWNSPLQLPIAYARGLRTRNQEGRPPWLLTVEKVGQVSQALLCSFRFSQQLSSSLLPNPARSCSTNVMLEHSNDPL